MLRRNINLTCWLTVGILLSRGGIIVSATTQPPPQAAGNEIMTTVNHLTDFQAIEFRRYTIKPGGRDRFTKYFEAFFPEAFEQLGAIACGQFAERENPLRFTWLRGFHSTYDRPIVNSAFYFGPLWREHKAALNALMDDSDNVLLLRPLHPEGGVPVLPAVDPVTEQDGAKGVVVAQIFPIAKQHDDTFIQQVDATFAAYRGLGVHEAGVLISIDAPNNFPQLPVRTDGPFLVWLGIVKDDATLSAQLAPRMKTGAESLQSLGLVTGAPELVVLDPTHRSRLRWLPTWLE